MTYTLQRAARHASNRSNVCTYYDSGIYVLIFNTQGITTTTLHLCSRSTPRIFLLPPIVEFSFTRGLHHTPYLSNVSFILASERRVLRYPKQRDRRDVEALSQTWRAGEKQRCSSSLCVEPLLWHIAVVALFAGKTRKHQRGFSSYLDCAG